MQILAFVKAQEPSRGTLEAGFSLHPGAQQSQLNNPITARSPLLAPHRAPCDLLPPRPSSAQAPLFPMSPPQRRHPGAQVRAGPAVRSALPEKAECRKAGALVSPPCSPPPQANASQRISEVSAVTPRIHQTLDANPEFRNLDQEDQAAVSRSE